MSDFRTPLSRARGLGSAKHGVSTWLFERVSSITLVPIVLWAVFSGLKLASADYQAARVWMQSPVNAVLTLLLIIVGIWHMHVGLRVVIEDYISKPLSRAVLLLLNMFVCGLSGALAVFSILKVALSVGGLDGGAL